MTDRLGSSSPGSLLEGVTEQADIQSGLRMMLAFMSLCKHSRETLEVYQLLRVGTDRVRSQSQQPK